MADPAPLALLRPAAADTDPHGRRYTASEKEAFFQFWRREAGRSRRKVAAHFCVSESTLSRWFEDERWLERAAREDAEDAAAARSSLMARLLPGADRMLCVLEDIALDPKAPAMARVKAAVELCAMAGLVPPRTSIAAPLAAPDDSRTRVSFRLSDLSQLTPQELAAFRDRGEVPGRFRLGPPALPPGA